MNASMASSSDYPLRTEIDRILEELQAVEDQVIAFEKLRSTHLHTVRRANLSDFCESNVCDTTEYDCFTFALDLIDCPERIAVREYAPRKVGPIRSPGIADVLPGPTFLDTLMLSPQQNLQSCRDQDLVVYCDKFGNPQHGGKVIGGEIVSKWGMKGGLWQHGLWEVPSSYGTSARFYSHQPKDLVRQKWIQHLGQVAKRVKEFLYLAHVILKHQGKGLSHIALLNLATKKAARQVNDVSSKTLYSTGQPPLTRRDSDPGH